MARGPNRCAKQIFLETEELKCLIIIVIIIVVIISFVSQHILVTLQFRALTPSCYTSFLSDNE